MPWPVTSSRAAGEDGFPRQPMITIEAILASYAPQHPTDAARRTSSRLLLRRCLIVIATMTLIAVIPLLQSRGL